MYNNESIILTAIFIFPALPEFPSALEDQNFPFGEIPSPLLGTRCARLRQTEVPGPGVSYFNYLGSSV